MLKRNVVKEIRVSTEYKSWNRKVKELMRESKGKLNEEFSIKLFLRERRSRVCECESMEESL